MKIAHSIEMTGMAPLHEEGWLHFLAGSFLRLVWMCSAAEQDRCVVMESGFCFSAYRLSLGSSPRFHFSSFLEAGGLTFLPISLVESRGEPSWGDGVLLGEGGGSHALNELPLLYLSKSVDFLSSTGDC